MADYPGFIAIEIGEDNGLPLFKVLELATQERVGGFRELQPERPQF